MLLTEKQQNALIGFINMILSRRPASSLSALIQCPVILDVSNIWLYPLSKCKTEFAHCFANEVANVRQTLSGSLSGDALILLDYPVAVMLTNLLRQNSRQPIEHLNISACEVLTEVGNILLSSFLQILGNLMGSQITVSEQSFSIDPLESMINYLILEHQEIRYVLVVKTKFILCDHYLEAYLFFVSGVMPLSCMIRGIESVSNVAVSRV
ncbi:chemotaxis protein CheC [Limnospira sp. PMC 1042.18]|uniref:chemotaxis protein CheC n=1 Tax=Limnospira sp. PMC 1042.18 TaxID=2981018 RepID=UPI0028E16BDC|nr:chemotaxis protein CheC [Limnospira sp. PMC 1042.18]MDT9200026.1 chemotaxis protein CheC [Limnospira sp. PMC 1042.18]